VGESALFEKKGYSQSSFVRKTNHSQKKYSVCAAESDVRNDFRYFKSQPNGPPYPKIPKPKKIVVFLFKNSRSKIKSHTTVAGGSRWEYRMRGCTLPKPRQPLKINYYENEEERR
jgi:hypothetical protein